MEASIPSALAPRTEEKPSERFNSQIIVSFCCWGIFSEKVEVCQQQVGPNGDVSKKKVIDKKTTNKSSDSKN